MSREIKFRVFHKESSMMSYGIDIPMLMKEKELVLANEYSSYEFMQYSGILGKNGAEVYEGDIVIFDRGVGNWTGERMKTTHEVIFNDEICAFVLKYGGSYIKLRKHWNYIYEVIGNIHENPELLS